MTTVQEILTFLETLAPRYMKMEWDNVGLLCGRPGGRSGGFWWPWIPLRMCAGRRLNGGRSCW